MPRFLHVACWLSLAASITSGCPTTAPAVGVPSPTTLDQMVPLVPPATSPSPPSTRASKKIRLASSFWVIIDPENPCVGEPVRLLGNRLPDEVFSITLRHFARDGTLASGPGIQEMGATFEKQVSTMPDAAPGTWEAMFTMSEAALAPADYGKLLIAPDTVYDVTISGVIIQFQTCAADGSRPKNKISGQSSF